MQKSESKLSRQGWRITLTPSFGALIQALMLLLILRGAFSAQVKAYLLMVTMSAAATGLFSVLCLPELTNDRAASPAGHTRADRRWLVYTHALTDIAIPAIAAFELLTFRTAAYGNVGFLLGLLLCVSGFFLGNWALLHEQQQMANPGPDQTARIITGPYRWIRHPEYLSRALSGLAPVFMLGSLIALLPALVLTGLLLSRTIYADRRLRQGLAEQADTKGNRQQTMMTSI